MEISKERLELRHVKCAKETDNKDINILFVRYHLPA